jgi:type II secretory pathway component PulM
MATTNALKQTEHYCKRYWPNRQLFTAKIPTAAANVAAASAAAATAAAAAAAADVVIRRADDGS